MAKAKSLPKPIDPNQHVLERALYLADTYEVFVFPIPPNKKFTTADWHKQSHNLPSDIREEFKGISKNSNLGIDLSKYTDPEYRLFALDFDVEKETDSSGKIVKKDGIPVLKKGSTKHLNQFQDIIRRFDIPNTLTTRSATGGFHIILKVPKDVFEDTGIKASTKKTIKNYDRLDIVTGNVVAPTSVITHSPHKEYEFIDVSQIAEAPSKLLIWLRNEVFQTRTEQPNKTGTQNDFSSHFELAREECLQYIINMAPRAVEGQGGDETTLKVSDHLWDLTDNSEIVRIALELYNQIKCVPPWDTTSTEYKKFLRHPSQRAYRQTEAGEKGPKDFSDFPRYMPTVNQFGKMTVKRADLLRVVLARSNSEDLGRVQDYTEIPQRMFHISTSYKVKGNFIDHTLAKSGIGCYELRRHYLTSQQAETNYEYVPFTDNSKPQKGRPRNTSVIRLLTKKKRFFDVESEEFMPNFPGDIIHNGIYNTFNGFAVEYAQSFEGIMAGKAKIRAEVQRIHDRFFDIIELWANGDEELHKWLLQWIAKRVQNPAWKPQTSLLVQGDYGSGKSIVCFTLRMIMGLDYVRILGTRELESDFNGLNMDSLLTVFDEVDTIKDPRIIKKLDAKIGNSSEIINRKGIDQSEETSFSGVVITCNELPKGLLQANQRRYQICFMSDEHVQDKEFFKPLFFVNDPEKRGNLSPVEIQGLVLIYKSLMGIELRENVDTLMFNKTGMIRTIEQFEDKTQALSTWFISRVIQQQFNGHDGPYQLSKEPVEVTLPPLWDDYFEFALESDIENPMSYHEFCSVLKRNPLYTLRTALRPAKAGTNRRPQQKRRINYTDRSGTFYDQIYAYEFPSLTTLRTKVFKALGASVLKNMPNGETILSDFLDEYVRIPPHEELMRMKKSKDESEFEQAGENEDDQYSF